MTYEVITGECVETMRQMDADTFDLCVTSPPYDNLRQYKGYSFDFEATAKELYRVIKPGGVVVWVVADATVDGSETGTSFRQALYFKDECGFNLHDTMIYRKENPIPLTHNRYEQGFEFMFVFSKGAPATFNPLRQPCASFGRVQSLRRHGRVPEAATRSRDEMRAIGQTKQIDNVWTYSVGAPSDNGGHPAVFPERLAYDHIISWSNEGDRVLDPFCGSGTTGKMAVILKRKFVGIEINGEYAELARARITRASGRWAEKPRPIRRQIETPLFAEGVR